MSMVRDHRHHSPAASNWASRTLRFFTAHGAPLVLVVLLWWMLWWGHVPSVQTVEEAMQHVSWIGVVALIYVALQARSVLAQPRSGVLHSAIQILMSVLPLFVLFYALMEWIRGANPLSVFQVIVMVQAALSILIDVVIFNWFSLRLNQLSIQKVQTHSN